MGADDSNGTLYDKIGQFTTIPNTVIELWPIIGRDAFDLFVYLRYRSNKGDKSWPGYETIQKDTGMRFQAISEAIKTLEKYGLLSRRKRFSQSTIYTLKLPPVLRGVEECASPPGGGGPVLRGVEANQTQFNQTQILPPNDSQKSLRRGSKDFWDFHTTTINAALMAEKEDSVDATKTQVRTTVNAVLMAYGIDNLELEFKLVEEVWRLSHPDAGIHRPITAAQLKTRTLAAMQNGATRSERIKERAYALFHKNYSWHTQGGKSFLQFLIENESRGETLDRFAEWWGDRWPGNTGQQPRMEQIMEDWPQAFLDSNEEPNVYSELERQGYVIHRSA